jgi:hypothetical protein
VLGLLLATVVAVPLLIPGTPERAQARKYGSRYNYEEIIGRCKARCGGRNGSIQACIGRAQNRVRKNCRDAYKVDLAACVGSAPCKVDVKARFRLCAKSAASQAALDRKNLKRKGYGLNRCNGCCQRTKGGGSCLGYFESSRFYGSYKYRGRLTCVDDGSVGGGGSPCVAACDRAAKSTLKTCAAGKRAEGPSSGPRPRARGPVDPACAARVEEIRQACLRTCAGGSPSGAFLPGVSDAIRSRLARLVPWLVEGWSH